MEPAPELAHAETLAALAGRVERLEREVAELRARASLSGSERAAPPPKMQIPALEIDSPVPPPVFASVASVTGESLENRLGSQVFSRVGIVALLIGAAAFLKWAIDNRWIGPLGRVIAGLLAGIAVALWSERFRSKGFPAFSYALKAVGTGVLYLSLWAAFHLYQLLPGPAALAAMILVTAWNAWMAWAQDAELLAAYALAGGFATPALLSSGGNHEMFLFTYVAAIDLAVVALLRAKPWPRLLLGAFPATIVFYFGWYLEWYGRLGDERPLGLTSLFVAVFFALFAMVPIASRIDSALQEILPLANAAFAFVALYLLLNDSAHRDLLPWLALAFAALYLGLMRLPQTLAAAGVHLSLAVVFLTIAIPLKASGRWITIGWLVEGVALLGTASYLARSASSSWKLLRLLALGALGLGFVGLVSLPVWLYRDVDTAFLNARFATALVGIAVFAVATWIGLHAEGDGDLWRTAAGAAVVAINVVALQAGVLEIETFWGDRATLQTALSISGFLMLYAAGLLAVGFRQRSAFLRWQGLGLLVFTILKTFLYDVRSLSEGYRVASFLGLGAMLMAISFAYQRDWLALKDSDEARP
jgi:uncharacterized membrane protein